MPEQGKTSDVEIVGKQICKNMTPMHKIKMTFEKYETNVGNCICKGNEFIDSKSNPEG